MLTGYKKGFHHKDVQSLEDLNLISHKILEELRQETAKHLYIQRTVSAEGFGNIPVVSFCS